MKPSDADRTAAVADPALAALETALASHGLILRGAFHAGSGPGDEPGGRPDAEVPEGCRTLVLIGNAGPAMWRAFSAVAGPAPAAPSDPDPLDRWVRRVVDGVAQATAAKAVYPFDGPPYHPFLAWAQQADSVFPSPIGLMVHPEYGLWHGYRAALAFRRRLDLPPRRRRDNPCEACAAKPCRTACPVGAFADDGYDVAACRGHVGTPGGSDCRDGGCLARHACPAGRAYAYGREQARFHMDAFLCGIAGEAQPPGTPPPATRRQ